MMISGRQDAVAIKPGAIIVVVGPSGAGKDSIMSFAAGRFEGDGRVSFARRVITRSADAGGEAHECADPKTFARMEQDGGFAVSWRAHGLSYGVRRCVLDQLAGGTTVVVNGSRSALPAFAAAFPRMKVVLITARPEVLAERLVRRGRESRERIEARLARAVPALDPVYDASVIDNCGALAVAGVKLAGLIEEALQPACQAR